MFNHGSRPVNVSLQYEAPPGIRLLFSPPEAAKGIVIQPGGFIKVYVAISVSNDTLPGSYTVYLKAVPNIKHKPGLVVIGTGLVQRMKIIIRGKYSVIKVVALDPGGRIASNALIKLYKRIQGREVSIVDSYGTLEARVVPGRYIVRAYLAGELSANATVTLRPYESRTITLHLRIAYFELFIVKPLVRDGEIIGFNVHAALKNIYKTLNDANVLFIVERNGVVYDKRPALQSSVLPRGRSEFIFDYIPPRGLKPGNYTLYMVVYAFHGKLIAVSRKVNIVIEGRSCLLECLLALLLASLVVAIYYRYRRRRKRKSRRRG